MCWAVPGKITEIKNNEGVVALSGVSRTVMLDLLDAPQVGDYVLVHAGYAIQKVDTEKAEFTMKLLSGGNDA